MTMREFADSRNVDMKAVSHYMKYHGMKYDKGTGLTDDQLAILDKAYPLPQPVQLVEDTESRRELLKTQKALIEAQNALLMAQEKISLAEKEKFLLEAKTAECEELKDKARTLEASAQSLQREKAELEAKNGVLEEKLATYKKTWFGLYRKV